MRREEGMGKEVRKWRGREILWVIYMYIVLVLIICLGV